MTQLNSDLVGPYGPSTDPNSPDKVVVFGYSQGATVASIEKRLLGKLSDDQKSNLAFVLIGNPNRPNGGVFERLALLGTVPILDATFGQPTPTDTNINTTDIAFQYDGVADFPLYPINLLADLNAIAGFWYIHGTYLAPNGNSSPGELPNGLVPADLESIVADAAANCSTSAICQKQGDTTYITIPNKNLPILQPLRDLGAATGTSALTTPLADLVQPVLKVLIETGYDRNLPYGQPAPFRLIPIINPIKLTVDLIDAAGQGIHDALKDIGVTTPALPTPSLPAVPFAKTSQLNLASTNTVGGATLKSASQENLSVTTADTGSGDPKLKSNIRSAKTPVVIKPQRPIIRGPIGSELEKQVKGLVDAATGAFKPPTIKGAAGGKHTVTPGTPGLTEPKDTTTQNTTSQPQDAAA